MSNVHIQAYEMMKVQKDGMTQKMNERVYDYNGKELKIMEQNNGNVQVAVFDNSELYDMLEGNTHFEIPVTHIKARHGKTSNSTSRTSSKKVPKKNKKLAKKSNKKPKKMKKEKKVVKKPRKQTRKLKKKKSN